MDSIDRRSVLFAGLGAVGALAVCGSSSGADGDTLVSPSGSAVAATEKKRVGTGRQQRLTLTAAPAKVDLGGGVRPRTWAFEGRPLGKEVRLSVGETLVADLSSRLPSGTTTSVHWHGIALRNDMDGVPPLTQPPVQAGSSFTYRFVADTPGTYFLHPHVGVQLDRGLYAPLIVEDPDESLGYDDEWVVLLDDWLDGVTGTPDEVFAELSHGMGGMGGMGMGGTGVEGMGGMGGTGLGGASASPFVSASPLASGSTSASTSGSVPTKFTLSGTTSALLGGDAGDVKYPYHLINGRVATDPDVYTSKPGKRVRLRIINAGSDTAYRVALGGHKLTITHTDGFPVQHQDVDALLVGMGERYDVLVTLDDGVFPLVALAEGKDANGLALVRTGSGSKPSATVRPSELDGMIMTASELRAVDDVRLRSADVDVTHRIRLTGNMAEYNWTINGTPFDMNDPGAHPLLVQEGQRVQLDFLNGTDMWHPVHLHGHTYQIGDSGPRKDTAIVLPRQKVSVIFDADNPGQWMLHCHNAYHGEAGMMANLAYQV